MTEPKKKKTNVLKKSSKVLKEENKKNKESQSLKVSHPVSNAVIAWRANFINTYKSLYLKFNTNVNIQNYLNNPENDKNYLYSNAFNRLHTFFTFGYNVNFDIVNTITSIFKIKDMTSNTDSIFAFGYCNSGSIAAGRFGSKFVSP